MPQLDTSTYASQLFWLFLAFGLLYLFISRVFIPKMDKLSAERAALLASLHLEITQSEKEIEDKRTKSAKIIQEAKETAQNIIKETNNIIVKIKANALKEFSEKSAKIYSNNQVLIDQFKTKSKDELTRIVFDLAMKYYSIILAGNFTEKTVDFSVMRKNIGRKIEEKIIKFNYN